MNLKKLSLIIFLIIILANLVSHENAFSQRKSLKKKYIVFDIFVQDTAMQNDGNIEFTIFKNGINTDFTPQKDRMTYKSVASKTRLVVPLSTVKNYAKIAYTYKNNPADILMMPFNVEMLFLFESGDSIQMFLGKNNVIFKGKGGAKLNCVYELSKHNEVTRSQRSKVNLLLKNHEYKRALEEKMQNQDSLYSIKKQILDSYKTRINPEVFALLSADIWGKYKKNEVGEIFSNTQNYVLNFGELHKNAVLNAYTAFSERLNKSHLPDSVLAQSFTYGDFLFWKEYYREACYKLKTDTTSAFLNRYLMIRMNNKGALREKASLINFYYGNISKQALDQVYQEAIGETKTTSYKSELTRVINSKMGSAYAFEMPDENGRIHKLADFRGKVVIMDFWYTGCINCIEQAEKLKPIIRGYKDNPNVVFISVSIDGNKYKKIWIESLKKEIYSSRNETNLLAADGKNSGIIKHYNILGYPTLIILSQQGKVITTCPPDPRKSPLVFKEFIDKLLENNEYHNPSR